LNKQLHSLVYSPSLAAEVEMQIDNSTTNAATVSVMQADGTKSSCTATTSDFF
jgi:hypothetical protein